MAAAVKLPLPLSTAATRGPFYNPCLRPPNSAAPPRRPLLPFRWGSAALPTNGRKRATSTPFVLAATPRAEEEQREEERFPQEEEEEKEPEFQVLTSIRSQHNEIVVVDTPDSRVLLLDSTHNVHSILHKDKKLTGSYWDEFATLPAIIPKGPIAILGLGAGTAAHLMLDLWPSLHLEGWEIDAILVDKARQYFGLSGLEKPTDFGGFLSVNIGDALSPSASIDGGFAGIVVDLFSGGMVLPQLYQVETWLELEKRLMPNGRIMVNCAGAHSETCHHRESAVDPKLLPGSSWVQNSTVKALCQAFPGKLSWKRMAEQESENYLALTGPVPDLGSWSAVVPSQLSSNVMEWRPCILAA